MIIKYVVCIFALIFIILTLGFVSVEIEFTDGAYFKYSGWKRRK